MKIFIIPSWGPRRNAPLAGSFFIEQAHTMAKLRPDWQVALCLCDLVSSRPPRHPGRWGTFLKDFFFTTRRRVTTFENGMIEYRIWKPYGFFWQRRLADTINHLEQEAEWALTNFSSQYGSPDIILAMASVPAGTAAARLGHKMGIPVALVEHMGPFPWPIYCQADGSPVAELREAYDGAEVCAAVSSSLAKRIEKLELAQSVKVIPNYLADSHFQPAISSCKEKHFRFLSIGWPSEEKGTGILLKAFAQLDENVSLTIVGNSPKQTYYKTLCKKLGIETKVVWAGNVNRIELPKFYQECDAFVLPSQFESFGMVFIEALACGKPLIATNCGGPEDIVTSDNGFIVQKDDVMALKEAMRRMVESVAHFDSAKLRNDFEKRFSASAVISKVESWLNMGISNYCNRIRN